jgi:hypothetical protein
MADTLASDVLSSIPFVDAGKVRDLMGRITTMEPSERIRASHYLTSVLSACVLQTRFGL